MKSLNFFLLLWIIFALLDTDPLTWLNPDPKHWFLQTKPTNCPLILGVQAATGAHQGPGCQAEDGPAQGSVPVQPASPFYSQTILNTTLRIRQLAGYWMGKVYPSSLQVFTVFIKRWDLKSRSVIWILLDPKCFGRVESGIIYPVFNFFQKLFFSLEKLTGEEIWIKSTVPLLNSAVVTYRYITYCRRLLHTHDACLWIQLVIFLPVLILWLLLFLHIFPLLFFFK